MSPALRQAIERQVDESIRFAQRALMWVGAAALVGLFCAIVFAGSARAQVSDKPITAPVTQWTGAVQSIALADGKVAGGCVAGWVRSADRYGDWDLQLAFIDVGRITTTASAAYADLIAQGDVAGLTTLRSANVAGEPLAQPCRDKAGRTIPPAAWTVAPTTSGKRPAYLLKPDGTRGAQSGSADVTLSFDNGAAGTVSMPMWCNCKVRSAETTTSTYCTWALARQTFDPAEPVRVTLCREAK